MLKLTHTVPSEIDSPIRLQDYGVGLFEYCPTKSAWKKVLKRHLVQVNQETANSATFLFGGELIELQVPENIPPQKNLHLGLEVDFEDDYLAIVRKPAGILVSGNRFKTVAHALPSNLEPSMATDATIAQPVHRLDYATTGLLVVGKTTSSIRALNVLFETKQIKKNYLAITIGSMKNQGTIMRSIGNREAMTQYQVLDSVPSDRFGRLNLVSLQPLTGRRHQLRIHMAELGTPILGDRDYSPSTLLLRGKGMFLHAKALAFTHPVTEQELCIEDTIPQRFLKIFPEFELKAI